MINLTDYVSVEFTVTSIKCCIRFGVSKTRDRDTYENWAAVTEINKDENMDLPADNIVRVDVSNLTGTYYVAFGDWHTEYAEEVHVSAVKLVR